MHYPIIILLIILSSRNNGEEIIDLTMHNEVYFKVMRDAMINPVPVYRGWVKRLKALTADRYNLILLVVLVVAAFLHYRNFYEVVYIDKDEARAFTMLRSGPMLYLLCRPFYEISHTESAAFYVATTLGFLCIVLFYKIASLLFDKRLAVCAVVFYAIFPFRINYARSLYPAVFIDFFFLLLVLDAYYLVSTKRSVCAVVAGALSAMLFFVHPGTYPMQFGLMVTLLVLWITHRDHVNLKIALRLFITYLVSFFLAYLALELTFAALREGYWYTKGILSFGKWSVERTTSEGNNILPFFSILYQEMTLSLRTIIRSILVITAVVFSIVLAIKKRKGPLPNSLILVTSGLGIFFLTAIMGIHKFRFRHFIWICPFLSLFIASTVTHFISGKDKIKRLVVVFLCTIFLITSLWESYMVTVETFKMDAIKAWIKSQGIKKTEILTFLHLYSPGDADGATFPPINSTYPAIHEDFRPYLVWGPLRAAYHLKKFKYIIPTGLHPHNYLADDIMFKHVKPLISWEHPHSKFKYRGFGKKLRKDSGTRPSDFISVYSLDDVFSKENLLALQREAEIQLKGEKKRNLPSEP